jgi:hypothetical protein
LASYRNAIQLYRTFREGVASEGQVAEAKVASTETAPSRRVHRSAPQAAVPPEHARTMADFDFDGQAALTALVAASRYGSIAQAIASLTVFSHPKTVEQTGGRALFRSIRGTPGKYGEIEGQRVLFDDNRSPTAAFLWSNGLGRRGRDTQFNHIYAVSDDVDAYTALPNICMTPAFLAKLTDTNAEVRALLAYRSFDLYGWRPRNFAPPERPESYASLAWAAPLPPVPDLRQRLLRVMARKPKDRTVLAAQRLGWLFEPAAEMPRP